MENWRSPVVGAGVVQEALIVALRMVPLVLVSISAVPALLILPFTGQAGSQRAERIVQQLIQWNRVVIQKDTRRLT